MLRSGTRWWAPHRVAVAHAWCDTARPPPACACLQAAPAAGPAAHHHIARALLEVAARSGSAGTQTAAGVLGDGARSALLAAFCDKVCACVLCAQLGAVPRSFSSSACVHVCLGM